MSLDAAVTGGSVRLSYIPLIQNTDSMPETVGEGGKAVTWLAMYLHTSLHLKMKAGFLQ